MLITVQNSSNCSVILVYGPSFEIHLIGTPYVLNVQNFNVDRISMISIVYLLMSRGHENNCELT